MDKSLVNAFHAEKKMLTKNSAATHFRFTLMFTIIAAHQCANGSGPPSSQDFAANWHQWRGPNSNGSAPESATPPVIWNATTNIQWMTDSTECLLSEEKRSWCCVVFNSSRF